MSELTEVVHLPAGLNWRTWIDCWDRMQERYLVQRQERFNMMARLIRETQPVNCRVLDLGCGCGSTSTVMLTMLQDARVVGIDLDPTLLPLARQRLAYFGERVELQQLDLRMPDWFAQLPLPFDAVVSATALHWLSAEQLDGLYRQLARILRPGGIFLNADHVPSTSPAIQQYWERHREEMRCAERHGDAPDWYQFWEAYGRALCIDIPAMTAALLGEYAGEEQPLSWHLDHLRVAGFTTVDCFWRCDCDAIYGGVLS